VLTRLNRSFRSQRKTQTFLWHCYFFSPKKHHKLQECHWNIFEIETRPCLALHWSSFRMLLLLFMVCGIAHFGCYSATVCILIPWQLSAPVRRCFPMHSCTYDQNHWSLHFLDVTLSYFCRSDADLSASVEPA